jgi:hypothetical protein
MGSKQPASAAVLAPEEQTNGRRFADKYCTRVLLLKFAVSNHGIRRRRETCIAAPGYESTRGLTDVFFLPRALQPVKRGGFDERQTNLETTRPFREEMGRGRSRTGFRTLETFQKPASEKDP